MACTGVSRLLGLALCVLICLICLGELNSARNAVDRKEKVCRSFRDLHGLSTGSQGASSSQREQPYTEDSKSLARRSMLTRRERLASFPIAPAPRISHSAAPAVAMSAAPAGCGEGNCDMSPCHTPAEIQAIQDNWPRLGGIGPELVECKPANAND